MRSKFIVKVPPKTDKKFPTDDELRSQIRTYGWEARETSNLSSEDEKLKSYKTEGAKLFVEMPEVAQEEKDDLIYYGYLASDQASFVVTRSSEGELTYRLLQHELPNLIRATEKIIKSIEAEKPGTKEEYIINKSVLVYEKNQPHVILEGRVIENRALETFKTNLKDSMVVLVSSLALLLILPKILFNYIGGITPLLSDSLERLAISVVVVLLVSLAGIVLTYRDIKTYKIISWNLKRPERW